MNNQFSPELLEKAKSAKSASELITLAKENEITLTEEQASAYYEKLNPKFGAVADEELDNVSGGCGYGDPTIVSENYSCGIWRNEDLKNPSSEQHICMYCVYFSRKSRTAGLCTN